MDYIKIGKFISECRKKNVNRTEKLTILKYLNNIIAFGKTNLKEKRLCLNQKLFIMKKR